MVGSIGKEWSVTLEEDQTEAEIDFTYHPSNFFFYAFAKVEEGSGTVTISFQGGWDDYWETLFSKDVSDTDGVNFISNFDSQRNDDLDYLEGERVPLIWPKHRFKVTRESAGDEITVKIFTRERHQ